MWLTDHVIDRADMVVFQGSISKTGFFVSGVAQIVSCVVSRKYWLRSSV